ncbi:hypothetical protein RhiirA4_459260 [Rhizophagus irregularis]|uniref:Uncharacterized protein n=1 Tax=Rhizophagus irregularis TaxID=588596 RepID=A0A2I1GDX8_9GLOM|nr:hypothetical protein RhiirA4_459260 [Rhizophagus irregularis]
MWPTFEDFKNSLESWLEEYHTNYIKELGQREWTNNFSVKHHAMVGNFERQSIASSDRKSDGRGRRPDIMLVTNESDKLYELMYVECS